MTDMRKCRMQKCGVRKWLRFCISAFCISAFPLPALAVPLVADLSNYRIDMDSGFNGTRIFLFGARNDSGDVVVVVRGPAKNYILRNKEPIAGIWINSDRMKFWNIPAFYAIASSRPLSEIEQDGVFRQLGIGEESVLLASRDPQSPSRSRQFAKAFLRHQHNQKLYVEQPGLVSFMGETLFKTVIEFPDNIPPGDYTAEIYLLSDGEISGMQSTPITVVKTGLDAFLYNAAHRFPALYGIAAILLALSIGWAGGRVFERR